MREMIWSKGKHQDRGDCAFNALGCSVFGHIQEPQIVPGHGKQQQFSASIAPSGEPLWASASRC